MVARGVIGKTVTDISGMPAFKRLSAKLRTFVLKAALGLRVGLCDGG
jgi:hypothetical protein